MICLQLTDMYVCSPQASSIHIRQISHAHVTTITYVYFYSSYEGSQHTINLLINKVSLRNSYDDDNVADPDIYQNTTTDTDQVEISSINPDSSYVVDCNIVGNISSVVNAECLSGTEDDVNTTSDTLVVCPIVKVTFAENSNENTNDISDHMVLQSNSINTDNTATQDEITEINASTAPERFSITHVQKMKCNTNPARVGVNNARYKVALVFTMCCVIGCCLMPVILYYVNQTVDNAETGSEYSHGKNVSTKVCYKLKVHILHGMCSSKLWQKLIYSNISVKPSAITVISSYIVNTYSILSR